MNGDSSTVANMLAQHKTEHCEEKVTKAKNEVKCG